MAWFSERRRLLWATLRAGHAGTANGAQEFLVPAFTLLPAGYRIGLVRADAGAVVTAFRRVLETRDLRTSSWPGLPRSCVSGSSTEFQKPTGDPSCGGIAVADVRATFPAWRGQARRFVGLRQTLTERPTASGRG